MLQILYKYFVLNKKVVIPGIGIFYIHRKPASLDFSNKTFVSPAAQIAFTPADAVPDTIFYSFVSREKQIEEADALLYFTNFINRVKESLHTKGRVELNGFGVLSTDEGGAIQFDAAQPLPFFMQDVSVERAINDGLPEQILSPTEESETDITAALEAGELDPAPAKKDYRWVLAVILATAAIAAIIYYYARNGSFK
ncbi:MAG: hypothetical protein M3040_10445 [Bacteroidota bacterium]|nr:hypothetical protein [Bacteroidota bacterium]